MNTSQQQTTYQSTAGAVPVLNEKGEVSMKTVKVQRYISGKKPEYAQGVSSDEDSEVDDFIEQQRPEKRHQTLPAVIEKAPSDDEKEIDDPRLRRLRSTKVDGESRRREHEPEVIEGEESSASEKGSPVRVENEASMQGSESEDSEVELDEEEIEKRRQALRAKLSSRAAEGEEVFGKIEDDEFMGLEPKEESSSEDEYTDSEEDTGPRVKPVFVRASERASRAEKERLAKQTKKEEAEARREKEERRRAALQLVEATVRAEQHASKGGDSKEGNLNDVCTDDENDELEYEAWKLREMKRIKRDKEEKENYEKELLELERLRNMTEEERRVELRNNPKVIINKAAKGKYKFLQKYYHRGAFYLDKDEDVLKQDFSGPTLDDHFDKSVLPKVMQVKKFGRSGRTKYTHLVDQDTTEFDSAWSGESAQTTRFIRGGTKQIFERPSAKRKYDASVN